MNTCIRIFHECEVWIEKSVRGLCRVMPNSDPEGRIFLSAPNNHDVFVFLHNVGVAMNEPCSLTLTSTILEVDIICDITMTSVPIVLTTRATWLPIQPMYWQHVLLFVFYPSHRSNKGMCKIRFVSTGENCGKPCLACKNNISSYWDPMSDRLWDPLNKTGQHEIQLPRSTE